MLILSFLSFSIFVLSGCSSETEPGVSSSEKGKTAKAARSGKTIYATYCFACHDHGAAGAPLLNQVADWDGRIEKGYEGLLLQIQNGLGAMPKNGSCFDCSDEELKAVLDYMLFQIKG